MEARDDMEFLCLWTSPSIHELREGTCVMSVPVSRTKTSPATESYATGWFPGVCTGKAESRRMWMPATLNTKRWTWQPNPNV